MIMFASQFDELFAATRSAQICKFKKRYRGTVSGSKVFTARFAKKAAQAVRHAP
jgi:hypothetical protein